MSISGNISARNNLTKMVMVKKSQRNRFSLRASMPAEISGMRMGRQIILKLSLLNFISLASFSPLIFSWITYIR